MEMGYQLIPTEFSPVVWFIMSCESECEPCGFETPKHQMGHGCRGVSLEHGRLLSASLWTQLCTLPAPTLVSTPRGPKEPVAWDPHSELREALQGF